MEPRGFGDLELVISGCTSGGSRRNMIVDSLAMHEMMQVQMLEGSRLRDRQIDCTGSKTTWGSKNFYQTWRCL